MDKIIYHSIVLRCDPHKAFEMFTINKHLEKWLTQVADVEPRVGGKYELFWNPKDREMIVQLAAKYWLFIRTDFSPLSGKDRNNSSTS